MEKFEAVELFTFLSKFGVALLPVPVVFFVYRKYFRTYSTRRIYILYMENLLYGIAFASTILFFNILLEPYEVIGKSPLVQGFVKAALVEKGGAFLLLTLLIKRMKQRLVILDSVISGMLFGIGFSALENIFYATGKNPSIIFVRFLSAVPLHTATCGLIAYHMAQYFASNTTYLKTTHLLKGILFPYLAHAIFDFLLLSGGSPTYFLGPILVTLIVILEYSLARSHTLPPIELLDTMELRFEDWRAIQREPQFERWILRSMGSKQESFTPFFQWHLEPIKIALIVLLSLTAILSLPYGSEFVRYFHVNINSNETVLLFSILPATFAFNIIAVGAINPAYFRNSIIRIPIIVDAEYRIENQKKKKTIAYEIAAGTSLLKTIDEIEPGTKMQVKFIFPGFESPTISAITVWDNHIEGSDEPSGTVIRFTETPANYKRFMMKYFLFRISRGLSFNLKLPGFEGIRKLFVRPQSVMQKEKSFRAGEVVIEEGEVGREFYLILKGQVMIFKTINDEERMVMATLEEGDIFGEMAIVSNKPRAAGAICLTDCRLAIAEGGNLHALIESNPEFTLKLITNFANSIYSSEGKMKQSLSSLENLNVYRENIIFNALYAALLGMENLQEENTIKLKVNIKNVCERTGLDPTIVNALFRFLVLKGEVSKEDLIHLGTDITSSGMDLREKLNLSIEDTGSEFV